MLFRSWPVILAAEVGGGREAAEALRLLLDAGGRYHNVGDRYLHWMPPLVAIAATNRYAYGLTHGIVGRELLRCMRQVTPVRTSYEICIRF